jgi:hypothetical protein
MAANRSWLPIGVTVALIAAGVTVVLLVRPSPPVCATSVPAHSPLVAPSRFSDDEHLTTLAQSVKAMPAPFGPVRAGVGFNYGQWLHLYGVEGGVLAFTKNNAPVTLLDGESLKPRWALKPARKRIAWDVIGGHFLLLDLAKGEPTRVASYDLTDGSRRFCVELPVGHAAGQPIATASVGAGADVLVALPADKHQIVLARLAAESGSAVWTKKISGVSRADFLSAFGNDQVVIGGTEEYRLAQPTTSPAGPVIAALSAEDGSTVWRWKVSADTQAHVVGTDSDQVLVMTRSTEGAALVALDAKGNEVWRRAVTGDGSESTLRGQVVITRSWSGLTAYDATSGAPLWTRAIPTDRTFFPYGFTLGQMPSLDATHLLVPTTTSLEVLDVTTGKHSDFALPTDGINTTYWPYQLVSTSRLIGVVTNTGGVLADREVGALR